jgi:hypothetical protein
LLGPLIFGRRLVRAAAGSQSASAEVSLPAAA